MSSRRRLVGAVKAAFLAAAVTAAAGTPALAGGGGGNDCNGCPNMGDKTAKSTYYSNASGNDCGGNNCSCGDGTAKATFVG